MKPQFSSIPMQIYKDFTKHLKNVVGNSKKTLYLQTLINVMKSSVHFEMQPRNFELSKGLLTTKSPFAIKLPYEAITIVRKSEKCGHDVVCGFWENEAKNPESFYFWCGILDKDSNAWCPNPDIYEVKYKDIREGKIEITELIKVKTSLLRKEDVPEHMAKSMFQMMLFSFLDLAELCWALSMKSTKVEVVDTVPKLHQKLGKRHSKLQRDFYKLNRVTIATEREVIVSESKGGTHASPRWHKRRGYWRTMKKSGKQIWVRSCEVGSKSNGMVYKDYEVQVSV